MYSIASDGCIAVGKVICVFARFFLRTLKKLRRPGYEATMMYALSAVDFMSPLHVYV